MNIAIFGFGVSGKGAYELLKRTQGVNLFVYDENPLPEGVEPFFTFDGIKYIVLSPGIALTHPYCIEAQKRKIPLCSDIQLALSRVSNFTIGVTGTNGKTTAVSYLEHCIDNSLAIGNIGKSACEAVIDLDSSVTLIVELSSFQLETCYLPLFDRIVFLNLAPDHLDRYANFDAYKEAKWRIAHCLKEGGKSYTYCDHQDPLEAFLRGEGIAHREGFVKPAHRMEEIANIGGVRVYNDSKATNIAATIHALKTIQGTIVLIAGGRAKEPSFTPLAAELKRVKCLIAIGEAQEKMATDLKGIVNVIKARDLSEAVDIGMKCVDKDGALLLSPACSSYDAYNNYQERGNHFKQLVKRCT